MLNPTTAQIKEARTNAGLSMTKAADLIHCHLQTWAKWERGERQMHAAFWELFNLKCDPNIRHILDNPANADLERT